MTDQSKVSAEALLRDAMRRVHEQALAYNEPATIRLRNIGSIATSALASARELTAIQPAAADVYRERWEQLHADPESMRHLLRLLMDGKGTPADFDRMVDRIRESKRAALAAVVWGVCPAEQQAASEGLEHEDGICDRCGESFEVPSDLDESAFCNLCAQVIAAECVANHATLPAGDEGMRRDAAGCGARQILQAANAGRRTDQDG